MIYTVTLNPSLDYRLGLDRFISGRVNRAQSEHMEPGGKGINVSLMLNNLGFHSVALGFLGGFTGKEIERRLQDYGITTDFIGVKENSRINVKISAVIESEINAAGPYISEKKLRELEEKLELLNHGDVLVLAGSIPACLPQTIYKDLCCRLEEKKILIVVDATKDLLVNTLPYHPFLIKPNHIELEEIFGVEINTKEDAITYGQKLRDMGARNVLVSMAGKGAVLLDEEGEVFQADAPKGTVVNSVGAGDSMVAGFLAGYVLSASFEEAFYKSICAGSASTFTEGIASRKEVDELLKSMGRSCI